MEIRQFLQVKKHGVMYIPDGTGRLSFTNSLIVVIATLKCDTAKALKQILKRQFCSSTTFKQCSTSGHKRPLFEF
jgi:hypothetical protein